MYIYIYPSEEFYRINDNALKANESISQVVYVGILDTQVISLTRIQYRSLMVSYTVCYDIDCAVYFSRCNRCLIVML